MLVAAISEIDVIFIHARRTKREQARQIFLCTIITAMRMMRKLHTESLQSPCSSCWPLTFSLCHRQSAESKRRLAMYCAGSRPAFSLLFNFGSAPYTRVKCRRPPLEPSFVRTFNHADYTSDSLSLFVSIRKSKNGTKGVFRKTTRRCHDREYKTDVVPSDNNCHCDAKKVNFTLHAVCYVLISARRN